MKRLCQILSVGLCVVLPSKAEAEGCASISLPWLRTACECVSNTYHSDSWDLYLTGYAWHDPKAYGKPRHDALNQHAWGGGIGKHWNDPRGHQDLLYAFVFMDSHYQLEPVAGYGRQWFTKPLISQLQLGGGFTVGITSRADIFHRAPIPLVLPVASVRYANASLMATVIPRFGGKWNRGTIAFIWGRYEF